MKLFKIFYSEIAAMLIFSLVLFMAPAVLTAQNPAAGGYDRDTLLTAAQDLIHRTKYCALVTLDTSGHPQVRTMDPFYPDENMTVWLGTHVKSRKVKEIQNDSRVTLYYVDSSGAGYVVIKGNATIVDEAEKKKKYWKKEWEAFYSEPESHYVLIKIIPIELEIIDYKYGIIGDSDTWTVPKIKFNIKQ